jgi:glycosyltransferase involved in cell wall biosynthesis
LQKYRPSEFDVVILGARGDYYGQPLVPVVKKMTRKPVVFDAVLALYETSVIDRRIVDERSLRARLFYILDYLALHNADLVLSDTIAHMNYYSNIYRVDFRRFRRILVSSDDDVFYPRKNKKKEGDYFSVVFWGGFIPLQGVEYIIKAAKLLESHSDIRFELRGFGQTYSEDFELSKKLNVRNVAFVPNWVPYEKLPNYVAKADVCLGVFGNTEKAPRVIPNKAVEALAMRKPLITGDSPAAREILRDSVNSILVPMANPEALAEAILTLKENKELSDKIAENGYRLFKEKLAPKAIGKELKSILIELIEK